MKNLIKPETTFDKGIINLGKYTLPNIFAFILNYLWGGVAVLNGLAHEFTVTPGNVYKGQIELKNASEITQVVMVYQANLSTKHTGETFYSDSIKNARSIKNAI